MKTKKIFLLAAIFATVCALPSCYAPPPIDAPKCTGNCTDIVIAGKVHAKTDGQPIANVPIDVSFIPNQLYWANILIVATTKSDRNGAFRTVATIDTSLFKDYSLHVSLNTNGITSQDEDPCDHSIRFSSLDRNALESISFELYYLGNLTIKLRRTTADSIEHFYIHYEHPCGYDWMYGLPLNIDEYFSDSLQLEGIVATGTYTRITWGGKMYGKSRVQHTDSVLCKKNQDNVYAINF